MLKMRINFRFLHTSTAFLAALTLLLISCSSNEQGPPEDTHSSDARTPNVIIIYTDDVGYGDVGAYGGNIETPHIDRLAEEGLMFSSAYATSATCTPSRYSLLTGEYPWRKQGTGVASGVAPSLIEPGRDTWPLVMQRAGYRTRSEERRVGKEFRRQRAPRRNRTAEQVQ